MSRNRFMLCSTILTTLVFLVAIGCNKTQTPTERADSQVAADIQNKINSDSNLPNKQIAVGATNGVVTLSGTVGSESERLAAANDASQIDGVKTVVNNLVVSPASSGMAANETLEPSSSRSRRAASTKGAGNKIHTSPSGNSQMTDNGSQSPNVPYSAPMAPPARMVDVTVPPGTILSIRTIDPIDTARAQTGDAFTATLDSPIEVDGHVVIPEHSDVQGRVSDVKSAGKFEGSSVLALQLTKVSFGGRSYRIITDQWSKTGASRGKNTAEKVGGGAAIGAIIGAIAGGGKGAAIGAGVGGGVGGGAQAMTHGQQIVLQPETVLQFTLRSPVTVTPSNTYRNQNRNRISDSNNP